MSTDLKKILLIEDNEDIAVIVMMTLENIGGFEIKHSLSGQEALELLPSYHPQLILLDVMMPEMDGIETFKKIRLTPEGENIPIIFMTAKAQTHEQEAYLELGAIGVLVKPFNPMDLCEMIQELWAKHV